MPSACKGKNRGMASQVSNKQANTSTHWRCATSLQSYEAGTACDVADRERASDLHYICANDGQTRISSVKELHSCSYQIILATPLICKHPAFKNVEVCPCPAERNNHACEAHQRATCCPSCYIAFPVMLLLACRFPLRTSSATH